MPQMDESKTKNVNKLPVGFRITSILTDYAQKLPKHNTRGKVLLTLNLVNANYGNWDVWLNYRARKMVI